MNDHKFSAKCLGIFIRDWIEDRDARAFDWSKDDPTESDTTWRIEFVDVGNADQPRVIMEGGKQFLITITEIST